MTLYSSILGLSLFMVGSVVFGQTPVTRQPISQHVISVVDGEQLSPINQDPMLTIGADGNIRGQGNQVVARLGKSYTFSLDGKEMVEHPALLDPISGATIVFLTPDEAKYLSNRVLALGSHTTREQMGLAAIMALTSDSHGQVNANQFCARALSRKLK